MIYHEYIADLDIQYFYCVEPFKLDALMDRIELLAQSPGSSPDLGKVALYDLRNVNLMSLTAPEFERFISRRMRLGEDAVGNPCAFIVGDMGCYGMIRMYGALAEHRGLRNEDQTCITLAMGDAIAWLKERVSLGDADQIARIIGLAERKGVALTAVCKPLVRDRTRPADDRRLAAVWRTLRWPFIGALSARR